MKNTERAGGFWPTTNQELLLRAALLRGPESIAAWQQWASVTDVERLDAGSNRLLPLLYRSLDEQGIDHPLMPRLKGVYRRHWYKSQLLFHHGLVLIAALQAAHIPTLLLKGTALTILYYQDYGLRPMADLDFAVPTEKFAAALDILTQSGWLPEGRSAVDFTPEYLRTRHADAFRHSTNGQEVDLHWHILFRARHADDDLWSAAISTEVNGIKSLVLNHTDQLFHVCAHGLEWNPVPPLRWVADVTFILNKAGTTIDWHRLLAEAEAYRQVLPLKDGLAYVSELLPVSVPGWVLNRLRTSHVSRAEKIEYRARTRSPYAANPILALWLVYRYYQYNGTGYNIVQRLAGFWVFLQNKWGVKHLWQMPYYCAVKSIQRIRYIVTRGKNW